MRPCRKFLVVGVLFLVLIAVGTALASSPAQQPGDNQACLACHGTPSLSYQFPSGETWSLFVDEDVYSESVHGKQNQACTSCHPDISGYPHTPLKAQSVRAYQLERYQACTQCHKDEYQKTQDSIHGQQIAAGNTAAAICTDCHGAHEVTPVDESRTKIPQACSKCHAAISAEYVGSVHGKSLVDEGNRDVPTCVDCHGVHRQEDPRTNQFRLSSPQLCASCHANETMMAKYGLSTKVFDTYVADFHGTTVTLFERESPDLATNKPVCYDCHGVHNMQPVAAEDDSTFKANLVRVCQKCHPNATTNFPASWLSHYEPSPTTYPLVYYVGLFYQILIPAVIGFMLLYVVLEVGGRVRRLRRGETREE